ncbi:MAG: J domain-containing protein [Microthrixaceae bacterium]
MRAEPDKPTADAIEKALSLLGVTSESSPGQIRAHYRQLLLRNHPDHSSQDEAALLTMALTNAYQLLNSRTPTPPPLPKLEQPSQVEICLLDDFTLQVKAPASETLMLLIDMAHDLGEISYLDPAAGLLEIVIEFVEEPTSSVLLTMQGRSSGVTEVFCSVEPLSGGISPPADAVARLLLRTLTQTD